MSKCVPDPLPTNGPYPQNEDAMVFYTPMLDFSKAVDNFSKSIQANLLFEEGVKLYIKNEQNRLTRAPAFENGTRIIRRTATDSGMHAQNRTKLHFKYNGQNVSVVIQSDYILDGRSCMRLDREITGTGYASGEGANKIIHFNVVITPLPLNKLVRLTWDVDSTEFDKLFSSEPIQNPPLSRSGRAQEIRLQQIEAALALLFGTSPLPVPHCPPTPTPEPESCMSAGDTDPFTNMEVNDEE